MGGSDGFLSGDVDPVTTGNRLCALFRFSSLTPASCAGKTHTAYYEHGAVVDYGCSTFGRGDLRLDRGTTYRWTGTLAAHNAVRLSAAGLGRGAAPSALALARAKNNQRYGLGSEDSNSERASS